MSTEVVLKLKTLVLLSCFSMKWEAHAVSHMGTWEAGIMCALQSTRPSSLSVNYLLGCYFVFAVQYIRHPEFGI